MARMKRMDPLIRQEAATWHARLQSRSVTNDELDEFYRWRTVPENARAFEEIEGIWAASSALRDEPEVQRQVKHLRNQRWRMPRILAGWSVGSQRVLLTGAAFALLLIVLVVANLPRARDYSTAVGEKLTATLEDGSRVTLNTDSRIVVRFDGKRRKVELERGQVLFEVAHEPDRPFVVSSLDSTVTAIGTVFEVRQAGSATRVTLLQGRILVKSDGGRPAELGRIGDTIETSGGRQRRSKSDATITNSWVNGKIELRDVPLEAAIAEVNRYSARKVVLAAQGEAGTRISGVFATGDTDAFLSATEALLPLRQVRQEDGTSVLVERR